ncbi:hypothetical protein COV04_00360 [Candidatus Uhrbacteria bacterium CG10_big_fil_rev_8_21_14_0_10_48_11]|uniref:Integrase catalytic domain-containing protein n=1 Tax=Candidatus Uhrbacteria bacterium CG10_big_fil_rev_8_21_14_0_10_48_11 TaxID=1975037 RepID=A0A2M8LFT1_9BACT|nr:MAG: hypothetical protein COV04_00360 [Candidatus Uhrbacteria bacterium CG10_big_fil_rev_8_21_14_0_10_48_11]
MPLLHPRVNYGDMAYTINTHIAKVSMEGIKLYRQQEWGTRMVAKPLGVNQSTVVRWLAKAPQYGWCHIPSESSRPKISPRRMDKAIEDRIVELRPKRGRCSEVLQAELAREGTIVSLSTVQRVLKRRYLIKERSPWKKYHLSGDRPVAEKPEILVQMDNIHIMKTRIERMYVTTLIDVCSRGADAKASTRINTRRSIEVAQTAESLAPFPFSCIQTDHGSEFSTHFTCRLKAKGIRHRHSRIRQPNDNAHVERFNRTIQDDLRTEIKRYKHHPPTLNKHIKL